MIYFSSIFPLYLSMSLLPLLSESNLNVEQNKLGHQRTLLAIDLVSAEMHEFECCIIKIKYSTGSMSTWHLYVENVINIISIFNFIFFLKASHTPDWTPLSHPLLTNAYFVQPQTLFSDGTICCQISQSCEQKQSKNAFNANIRNPVSRWHKLSCYNNSSTGCVCVCVGCGGRWSEWESSLWFPLSMMDSRLFPYIITRTPSG